MSEVDRRTAITRWVEETVSLVEILRELLDERDQLRAEIRDLRKRLAGAADGLATVARELSRLGPLAERIREQSPAGPKAGFFRHPSQPRLTEASHPPGLPDSRDRRGPGSPGPGGT